MNILFLLRLWPVYGGGETVTICLANEMVKRGWNVSVVYFKDSIRDELPFISQKVEAIKIDGIDCDEFHSSLNDASKVARFLTNIVKEKAIDVVINQWWPVDFIKKLKYDVPAVKVVKCFHTALFSPTRNDGIKGILKVVFKPFYNIVKRKKALAQVDEFLPYVDKYVFLSPTFQRQYEFWTKDKEKWQGKLDAIPNPLVFDCEISEEALRQKENIVLVVGRMLESPKRISLVIKVWHELEKYEDAASWNLKIVGEGPSLDDYKQMAHDLGLKRISFEGFQQPQPYYEKAKIFLMTSAFEGFGMTLIEAQQMGVVPVVMDSFLSLHDIIKDGKNGFIVPNNDIDAFAENVIGLMKNEELLAELREGGLKSCQQFSVKKIVDRWDVLFNGLFQ
jgi:glycosyltransferase involved in cell wall biosynthesis